jgi:hypothetical protein
MWQPPVSLITYVALWLMLNNTYHRRGAVNWPWLLSGWRIWRMADSKRDDASGRLAVLRHPEPGAGSWVHRWMGDDFPHIRGDGNQNCMCKPYYVHPGDSRSLDEIADDMEEDERLLS